MRHVDQLEKIKKESDLHADKRTKALDYDNKLLKSQVLALNLISKQVMTSSKRENSWSLSSLARQRS